MFNVLIACLENWDTLQEIPFVLKKADCTVTVFCSKNSWLITNSYYDNWIESKSDINDYAEQLINLVEKDGQKYDWVILGDEKLLKLMNEKVESEELFKKILPLTKIENREILASKVGLSNICKKYSIVSPKFIVCTDDIDIEATSKELKYPVLLKLDFSWGGGGIIFCEDCHTFKSNLSKIDRKSNVIIQEFINGIDIGVEALFNKGELITYNASEVLQYFENQFSFTTKRNYFKSSEIESELIKIGRHIGINGFASIQCIYKPEEQLYYLIEVDIRPNFWIPYGRFTGSDFSEGVKKIINPHY
jgi:predicted ATP-grasp superfamily ATP-dependent carboligase